MIAMLLRLIGICRHDAMYREHREIRGRVVACFVCPCGRVVPVLERTADEHIDLVQKSWPARPGRV